MIEMQVAGIGLDSLNGQPIVILSDPDRRRVLPIWIGVAECNAIAFGLSESKPDRPLTHDLMLNLIDTFGGKIKQVEVNEISEHTYLATIRLTMKNESLEYDLETAIDARPSDAIALALRTDAPILVSEEVMAEGTVPANAAADEQEKEEFKEFVDGLKASDFKDLPDS